MVFYSHHRLDWHGWQELMLYGDDGDNIIGQYVAFCKVFNEQRKRCGWSREAILETIQICKDRNVLKEYLENRESEVISIMMTLYDEEKIMRTREKRIRREEQEKGIWMLVSVLRDLNISDDVILQKIQEKFEYSKEEAKKYIKK